MKRYVPSFYVLNSFVMSGYGRKRRPNRRYKRGFQNRVPFRRAAGVSVYRTPSAAFAQRVRSVVKAESKYLYSFTSDEFERTAPLVFLISNVVPGTDATERVGNWIQPTALYGHITVTGTDSHPAVQDTQKNVRCCLVQWNEDDSKNSFDGLRLLENTAAPGGPWRVSEKGTFTILWDKYFTIINKSDNMQFSKTVAFNVKMHKRPRVLWDGITRKKNHIYLCVMTDAVPTELPTAQADMQLRYTDS